MRIKFTIRFILFGLLAACALAATLASRAANQRQVVEWIEKNDGMAVYSYEYDKGYDAGKFYASVSRKVDRTSLPAPNWLCSLFGIDFFDKIVAVDIHHPLKSSSLSKLTALSALEHLNISSENKSDYRPISELKALRALSLSNVPIDALEDISGASNIEILDLYNTNISDITPIMKFKRLRSLSIYGAPISDISPLAKLDKLTHLELREIEVTDYSPVANLKNLQKFRASLSWEQEEMLRRSLPSLEF